ncbi:MAG: hypothetical protein AYK23_00805 [Candidatus Proteinoplasmatales archaeon SG8-5]|nr:MAG: hypothetical protein AYK23_00805 [Candidatus Proteinoplasmatales archaeon SG8-5]
MSLLPIVIVVMVVLFVVIIGPILFVLIIGFGDGGPGTISTPLGIVVQDRGLDSVTLLISYAQYGAKVDGTQISLIHEGTPKEVNEVRVYSATATLVATNSNGIWTYHSGMSASILDFQAGYSIVVTSADGFSSGDRIIFTSSHDAFGPTTVTV